MFAEEHRRKRVEPRHLMLAIRVDDEPNRLIPGTIASAGIVPLCILDDSKNAVQGIDWL